MKQLIITIIAIAALASCAQNELEGPEGGRKGEIQVTANIDGARTKAYMNNTTGLAGASFIVKEGTSEPTDFVGGTAYTGNVEATTGKVKFTTAPLYNSNDANAYLVAYFPGKALTGNAVEWDIDGKTDIMLTNAIWDAGKHSAPVTTGLNFNHQLARVEVVLKAEAGSSLEAVRKAWGNVEKIEFLGAPEKMKYDLGSAPAVTTSGTADFTLLADYDGTKFTSAAIPANDNLAANAMAMLAPVAPTANESFTLKVTTAGDGSTPIELLLPVNLEGKLSRLAEGYTHIVTMTFKANMKKIEVSTTTVDEWRDGTVNDFELDVPVIIAPVVYIEHGSGIYYQNSGTFYGTPYTVQRATEMTGYNQAPTGVYCSSVQNALDNEPSYRIFGLAMQDEPGSGSMTWQQAMDACKAKVPAGEWRLPRLGELMQVYLNKSALEAVDKFAPFATGDVAYYSATESSDTYFYGVFFGSRSPGDVNTYNKTAAYPFRCIREVRPAWFMTYGEKPFVKTSGVFNYDADSYSMTGSTTDSYQTFTQSNNGGIKADVAACIAEKPFHKLEIAETSERAASWQDAWTICANKTTGGGNWRLPRMSELMLMNMSRREPGTLFMFINDNLWSATEKSSNEAWVLSFGSGGGSINQSVKDVNYYDARCVREITNTPPAPSGAPATIEVGKGTFSETHGMFNTDTYTVPAPVKTTYMGVASGSYPYPDHQAAFNGEPPFWKFEVATDMSSGSLTMDDAVALCAQKAPAGQWRLPRLSELMVMYLNKDALLATDGFAEFKNDADVCNFWSATAEESDVKSWYLNFANGQIDYWYHGDAPSCNARCVREVP